MQISVRGAELEIATKHDTLESLVQAEFDGLGVELLDVGLGDIPLGKLGEERLVVLVLAREILEVVLPFFEAYIEIIDVALTLEFSDEVLINTFGQVKAVKTAGAAGTSTAVATRASQVPSIATLWFGGRLKRNHREIFIATANVEEQIPGPLHDRMDVLRLSGYTEAEKLAIARKHLLGRQRTAAGLKPSQLKVSVAALREVITGYTREAGVRELERRIAAICRHAAVKFASRRRKPLSIGPDEVKAILGHERRELEVAERTAQSGVATGLAWTSVGGEILLIEAASCKGKGELRLTGQLGDVMKESALAALTLLRSRAADLGIDSDELAVSDVHLHIPAGAVPKDGPSAGVAITIALASLFTDRAVRGTVAMTGEISLRGRVLPVGGVKEKVLAALAAGIRTILLPERNMADLVELPEVARKKLEFIPLRTIDDAFDVAFGRRRP